ncbi:MAG: energy transducer TonB [Leadbetterella sp.]
MQVNIPNPCSEDWNSMKIGFNSRFCDSCSKSVVDFTHMNRQEILEYLFVNHNKNICGRIRSSQLHFVKSDYLETIQSLSYKHKNTNLSFFLLTMGTLILSGCDYNNGEKNNSKIETVQSTKMQSDSIWSCTKPNEGDPVTNEGSKVESITMGKVLPRPSNSQISGEFRIAEEIDILPEFKGGIENLTKFIKGNMQYPEHEKCSKIEGTVYVTFMVTKEGKLRDHRILGSDPYSKNLEMEAIRIVKKMPDWIPGQLKGKAIDYQFNVPIEFKL